MKKHVLFFLFMFAGVSLVIGQIDTVTSPFVAGGNAFDWGMGTYQVGSTVIVKAEYQTANCDSVAASWLDLFPSWATAKAWTNIVDGGTSGKEVDGIVNDTIMLPEDFSISADSVGHWILLQVRAYYSDGTDAYSNGSFTSVPAYTDSVRIDTVYGFADPTQLGDITQGDTISFKGAYGIDDVESVQVSLMHLNESWGTVMEDAMDVYNPATEVGLKTGHLMVDYVVPDNFNGMEDLAEGDFFVLRTFVKYGDGSNIFFFSWLNVINPNVSVEPTAFEGFSMYPNPANNVLNIQGLSAGTYNVSVYSVSGAMMRNLVIEGAGLNTLSIDDLSQGIYFLDISGAEGRIIQKFSKQ